jgi:hypothetical protein
MGCNGSVASEKFQCIVHTGGKEIGLSGQKVVLLRNENFGPPNCKTLQVGLHGEDEPIQKALH